jgi:hypothetical protein
MRKARQKAEMLHCRPLALDLPVPRIPVAAQNSKFQVWRENSLFLAKFSLIHV